MEQDSRPRRGLLATVSALLLLDSITLTMVVPIIPDFLLNVDSQLRNAKQDTISVENHNRSSVLLGPQAFIFDVENENGRVGLLLSSKAILQLILNPLVGYWTARLGYSLPLFTGTVVLLLSLLMFAAGKSYTALFLARASQGFASSCIGITGMSLIADTYPEEPGRGRAMGLALSSAALGVLLGYPFGGFMYDLVGKTIPFIVVAAVAFSLAVIQFYSLDHQNILNHGNEEVTMWSLLRKDRRILLCGGAIGISTSAMAILEPCLPLWLMGHIKHKKWQLGTAFIPDSLGYALGTNVFSQIAYREGRTRIAVVAMITVGLSCVGIPLARSMLQLVIPHFLLGFGIGAVDAALVPLLATLSDAHNSNSYGAVYAIQQIAVSLAYALGPMLGGELVHSIGFPWLMTSVGIFNFIYCPILASLINFEEHSSNMLPVSNGCRASKKYGAAGENVTYKKFDEEN